MSNAIARSMPNDGPDRFNRKFKELQGQITELRSAPPYLRAGSVPATALSNPYVPGTAGIEVPGIGITTTLTELAGINLVVPASCTQLLIDATGHVSGANNAGSNDALWASVHVGAVAATALPTPWLSGTPATATSSLGTGLTGLTPGSTVRLGVWGATSVAAAAAAAGNVAVLAASLTWEP